MTSLPNRSLKPRKGSKMGIIESVLAEFETTDGTEYRIEYNEGDIVHMHIDSLRIDFSKQEFLEFATVIVNGRSKLEKDKSTNRD